MATARELPFPDFHAMPHYDVIRCRDDLDQAASFTYPKGH